jgi:uncharacterized protein (DUF1330 family)
MIDEWGCVELKGAPTSSAARGVQMSAYFILTQTVTDIEKYTKEYIPGVMPFLAKYKAEVMVADFASTPLQGDPARGVVVLRFPTAQAIKDFLDDPGYQTGQTASSYHNDKCQRDDGARIQGPQLAHIPP